MSNELVADIFKNIMSLSVKDAAQLQEMIKKEVGMPDVVASAPASQAEEAKEKTEFDVVLKEAGSSKIKVITSLKAHMGCGLQEAKKIVDALPGDPFVLKAGATKQEAEEIKSAFDAHGASVEIK